MKTQEIVDLKTELVARDAPRHRKYDVNMAAIGGSYDHRRMEGFWQVYSAITGRKVPKDREDYEFSVNFIPSIISAKRAFMGTVPSLTCPPSRPLHTGEDEAENLAERLERVIRGFWSFSNIGKRMNQMAYWNPALGSTVGCVWPDMESKRPMLQMRSPYGCYPVLADVDGHDLSQVVFVAKYKNRQAAAMFPQFKEELLRGQEDVDVCQYIDRERLTTVLADQYRVKDIENRWGFVPVVIIPNESFGEGPWGDDDISQVIPLQEEYIYRESLKTAILEQTIMQPLAIEGGENLPEEIPMGPRDAIPVQAGGRVYRVSPVQVPYQYLQAQSDLVKLIDRVGAIPEVMRSQFEGSVLTGRGVSTLMGPTQMAFNVKGNEIYPAIAKLNKMALQMWHKLWPRKEHTVYSMTPSGGVEVETFKTGEFGGWYENIVYVDASSYFDSQSRFVMVLQAVQNRLMSRKTAMQFVPGVDDSVTEAQLIKGEMEEDLQLQQASEAFGEANVQPTMGDQSYTNFGLEKGYLGKTKPMQPIGGIEAAAAGEEAAPEGGEMPTGLEGQSFLEDMIEFFSTLSLRGKVWLAGYIVSDPAYSPQSPQWNGIDVFLEEGNDKAAINTTMRNSFPEIWGSLNYHVGEPSPEEPSILIYDPDMEDVEFEEEMAEQPGEEEMMAALLGGEEEPPMMGGM